MCILLFGIGNKSFAQSPAKVSLDNGIKFKIPASFRLLTERDVETRYKIYRALEKPLVFYTSEDGRAELTVSISTNKWGNGDQELLKEFYKASLHTIFDSLTILKEEIQTVKKKNYVYLEYIGVVAGENKKGMDIPPVEKHYFLKYAIRKNSIMVFNFNCLPEDLKKYTADVELIMTSISVK